MDNILIVDDEPGITRLCKRVLESPELKVFTVSNAQQALEMMKAESFCVVLTDLRMPGMRGDELLKEITTLYPQTSVIIITGQATIESAIETLKNGAADYIAKPFSVDELISTVHKCVELNHLKRREGVLQGTLYLYQFYQEVEQCRSEKELLEFVFQSIAKTLKADTGSLFIFSSEKEKLVPVACCGASGLAADEISAEGNVVGWVAKNMQAVLIQDGFANLPQFENTRVRKEIVSSIVAPLVSRESLLGVICVNRIAGLTETPFDQYDIESIKIFTMHAALILGALRHQLALEELNKLKSEFVSNVSHELRTPLMSINGALELINDYAAPYMKDNKIPIFMDVISRNAKRMHNLISDLLDFSRIETNRLVLHCQPFSIKSAIEETLQDLKSKADAKGVEISVALDDAEAEIIADRERVIQVLINLVDNAIKFTPGCGKISVSCNYEKPDHLVMTVADSGIGIPREKHAKIFQEFYQVDGSASRQQTGFGLGLAIVKSIVQEHDGDISVESEVGAGSRFIVRLPRRCRQDKQCGEVKE